MRSAAGSTATLRPGLVVEQCWQRVPGGSASYIVELARALETTAGVDPVGLAAVHAGPPTADQSLPGLTVTSFMLPRAVLYRAWNRMEGPRPEWIAPQLDVVHATTWAIPPTRLPLAVTVHDLAFQRDPSHFTARGVRYFRRALERVRKEADVVIAPSEATAADCRSAGIEDDRVHVIPHGVRSPEVDVAEVTRFRARHNLTRDVVLWCGTLEPRKNLRVVLAAYEHLLLSGTDLDLVIVGPAGWGGTADDVRTAVARMPAGRVHLLGRLDRQELHAAYAAARVFCFPSLWEGFGMPVLEAMSHGTPVVTSRHTAMAEFSGDGALLVDPHDAVQVADAIALAAHDAHDALAASGRKIAQLHTWEHSADLHVAAYRAAIARA